MKTKSCATGLVMTLLWFSAFARGQNYTITLYDQQNGAGNVIMSYTGPMLTSGQLNGGLVSSFVLNPGAMHWSTQPIPADAQPGSFVPCHAFPDPGNGGPNGEASITCESSAPGTTNGVPLFSFCFQGGAWPLPVGTYNVDSANQSSCGNYFFAYSQTPGYSSYAFLNNGSIVVVKNSTRIVTSLADDGSPGTLRSVIASANSGDTITFGVTGTITLAQGTVEINKNLTISGPGVANLTISGNHNYTVFQVDSGAGVNISGVTTQDGLGGVNGGDIANYGVLTLTDSTLVASTPSNGQGGGLYNAGTANVTECTFTGSLYFGTASNGGGIYNGGTLSVVGSTFSNFGVGGYGAAIFNAGYFQSAAGTGTVTNSTFWQNAANEGAAIFDAGTSGTITVVNSTLSGNIGNSIVYSLYGGTTLKNTLLANSGGKNCSVANGPMKSGGYNLSADNSCSAFFTEPGDMNNSPAGLDPNGLKSNGGPTQTIAILATSPAFNIIPLSPTNYCTAADGATPIATDQRGISRPQVSACDIGAFEYSSDDDSALAELNGGNSFAGNQTVNGTLTATSFVGNGSGLTGINAATATTASGLNCTGCVGNPQLGIVYAAGDAQGGNAVNALALGGLPVSAFAPATGSPVYAPATGSGNYVAKAGDTMTGILNLPTDGLIAGGNEFVLTSGNVGVGTTAPESLPQYRSLHIDYSGAGFGGAFLELTHSTTGQKGRVVMDDHGFLLNAVSSAPVKIKAGSTFNGGNDPGNIYVATNGNVGINTGTPAATLDVNGTANFSGLVRFAPGQTFPGGGTITGVTAGTGLSGGGNAGNVALTNTGLLSLIAGAGINSTGGQTPTLSLNTTFTDSHYAQLGAANTFTAPQAVSASPSATAFSASGYYGVWGTGIDAGVYGNSSNNFGVVGNSGTSTGVFGTGGAYGVVGGGGSVAGVWGSQNASGYGVYGTASTATGTAGAFNVTNGAKILSGQNSSAEVFSVDSNGNVKTPASVTATTSLVTGGSLIAGGPVTIGGGTPIVQYVSTTDNLTIPALTPGSCSTFTTTALTGFTPGASDTIALGTPASLVSNLGSGIFLDYQAWETTTTASPTITIQVCNPTAVKYKGGATGTIRMDIFKH